MGGKTDAHRNMNTSAGQGARKGSKFAVLHAVVDPDEIPAMPHVGVEEA